MILLVIHYTGAILIMRWLANVIMMVANAQVPNRNQDIINHQAGLTMSTALH